MMLAVDPIIKISGACTAKKGGVDILGVVSGDDATCYEFSCNGEDVIIDGCEKVVCAGGTPSCHHAKITSSINVTCTGNSCHPSYLQCKNRHMLWSVSLSWSVH